MLSQDLIDRINRAIADEFEADPATFTPATDLGKDLGLDSLDSVDLIASMERTFKIKVPEAEARGLRTLGDIYTFIEKLLAQKPAG